MLAPKPLFITTVFVISVANLHLDKVFVTANPRHVKRVLLHLFELDERAWINDFSSCARIISVRMYRVHTIVLPVFIFA